MSIEGVLTYRHPHIWNHTSSKRYGTLHVQVSSTVSEQKIVAQVRITLLQQEMFRQKLKERLFGIFRSAELTSVRVDTVYLVSI